MSILGILMTLAFGFLTIRNFATGRKFFGVVSSIGLLLGLGVLWVDYERATNPSLRQGSSSGDPWAKNA
jgi:hypothetical protein